MKSRTSLELLASATRLGLVVAILILAAVIFYVSTTGDDDAEPDPGVDQSNVSSPEADTDEREESGSDDDTDVSRQSGDATAESAVPPEDSESDATPAEASIQAMVNSANPGDTVTVPAGIYRETVRIDKPLTLIAEPGAEIRGSDIWSAGWAEHDGGWISEQAVPKFDNYAYPCETGERCQWQEQVFVNGEELRQVESDPSSGEFSVDDDQRITLGDDPAGDLVEVSVRKYWIEGASNDVTIEGFTMTHAATPTQEGALHNGGHDNWTIQGNTLSHAHGSVVSLSEGIGLALIDNDISFGGNKGVHGWRSSDVQIQGNRIHNNHTQDFLVMWEAGGLKLVDIRHLTIEDNEVFENQGPGIWCDIDCYDTTIRNNRVHHNSHFGINYEISSHAEIYGNAVWENGFGYQDWGWGAGILVQNSSHTEVYDNVVAWNADGISVISQEREDWEDVTDNTIRDNSIIVVGQGHRHVFALAWLEDWDGVLGDDDSNNRGINNQYFTAQPDEDAESFSADWKPFEIVGDRFQYDDLDGFLETLGEDNATYLDADEVEEILRDAGIPLEPEARG